MSEESGAFADKRNVISVTRYHTVAKSEELLSKVAERVEKADGFMVEVVPGSMSAT